MRALRLMLLGSLVTMAACDGCGNKPPDFCPNCSGDTDTDTDADSDTDGDTDTDADTDTDVPFDGFSVPGDYAVIESTDDQPIEVELTDIDGDSNRGQEFYAVFVNAAEGAVTYSTRYNQAARGAVPQPEVPAAAQAAPAVSPFRQRLREWIATKPEQDAQRSPPPPMPELEVGETTEQFRVRGSLSDESVVSTTNGTLAALGETVAIYVDDRIGLDWDYECDGIIDVVDEGNPSYGFDNCDLEVIAGIVDSNIMVNLEAMLGEFSDVNGDDRVTVLVTPLLNWLPLGADDPDDRAAVIESYADPEVDLNEYNVDTNPASDYQEIIYVFAPDPYGYLNPQFTTTVEAYTGMSLAAQIASQTSHLIIYNQKVLEQAGTDEAAWLRQGIGAVAADLCGFGAIYFDDAWDYLDAPHMRGLTTADEEGTLSLEGRGAQYLFLRWLVDVYGTGILAELVQSSEVSTDNVEAAVAAMGGSKAFEDLVVQWQVAMLTSGVENIDGDPMMDVGYWPAYRGAEIITAPTDPPETPAPGTYYGANGYQRGLNFNGVNVYMVDGTTDNPTENEILRVTLGNTDHATAVSGRDFFGMMSGGYTGSVVRLTDLPYTETVFEITPPGEGFLGAVIRWNDPLFTDYTIEQSFSSSVTASIRLPSLPDDGTPIYGVGKIGDPWQIATFDPDELYSDAEFFDSDRWLIDLSDRALGSQVRVQIWLDRHYNIDGDIEPYDPWMAVVPVDWVPTPTETSTTRAMCMAGGGIDFAYPTSLLEYLYYQEVVTHTPILAETLEQTDDQTEGEEGSTGFDPCGKSPEDTAIELDCSNDWDSDGVLDADEPMPTSFYRQVLVRMCSIDEDLLEQDVWGPNWFDADTLDEDETPTRNRIHNSGGAADGSGEEAYLDLTLEGGSSYLLVVSGGTDQGDYEITMREIPG